MLCLGCELLYMYRYIERESDEKEADPRSGNRGKPLVNTRSQGYTYTTYITYAYIDLHYILA